MNSAGSILPVGLAAESWTEKGASALTSCGEGFPGEVQGPSQVLV